MPSRADVLRLQRVAKHYRALSIVLYSWKRGSYSKYFTLLSDGTWQASSAADAFA